MFCEIEKGELIWKPHGVLVLLCIIYLYLSFDRRLGPLLNLHGL